MAKGASRKKSRGASPSRQSNTAGSALRWYMSGVFTGVLACLIIWLMVQQPDSPTLDTPKVSPETTAESSDKPANNTRFDFFTLLPEREITVPVDSEIDRQETPVESVRYTLQAGSFRRSDDADRRRARLILMGLDAKVDAAKTSGDTWHRVYVGPFSNRSEMASARNLLISEGIETLLLKHRE